MRKIAANGLIGLLLFACTPASKIVVTNIQDLAVHRAGSYIYSLPRTRLAVELQAVRHTTIPGPYYRYAEQLLGIKGAPSEAFTEWEITGINVFPVTEPDPDYYYSIEAGNNKSVINDLMKFTEEGLVLNTGNFQPLADLNMLWGETHGPVHFTDLSVKKNYIDESRKKGRKSEIPIDMPVIRQKEVYKLESEKAREAADFIIKTRKRRFKLLAGQYEVFPEGQALETSVRELNKVEEEYLSLFTGITYSDTLRRTYTFIPSDPLKIERNIILRFSNEIGFSEPTSATGDPMVIEVKNLGFTNNLKGVPLPEKGPGYTNTLLYRIPDKAVVKVFYGSNTILEAELKVYQYGAFVPWNIAGDK